MRRPIGGPTPVGRGVADVLFGQQGFAFEIDVADGLAHAEIAGSDDVRPAEGAGERPVGDAPELIVDVAHNPAAAAALSAALREQHATRPSTARTIAIIGMLDDKDVDGIAVALDSEVDHWIAVAASSPRALPADELARRIANACGRPCRVSASLDDAMQYARRHAAENDRVLVTGSFYLVGPALEALELYSRSE